MKRKANRRPVVRRKRRMQYLFFWVAREKRGLGVVQLAARKAGLVL
jgi:hypothetical protein